MIALGACGGRALTEPDGGRGPDWSGGGFDGAVSDAFGPLAPASGITIDPASGSFQGVAMRVACSSGGDAVAYYTDVGGDQVRRYHAGVWMEPLGLPVSSPAVKAAAVSPSGAAAFAWSTPPTIGQRDETVNLLVASLSAANVVSGPVVVGDGGIGWWQEPSAPVPVLGMGGSGLELVAWSRIDQPAPSWPSAVWASHLAPVGTWQVDGNLDVPGGRWSTTPSVVMRANGDAIAVWSWFDGNITRLLVARRLGGVWSAPSVLEEATGNAGYGPTLAGGRTGDVLLVFSRFTMQRAELIARRSVDGQTWDDREVVAADGANMFQLVDSGAGAAVVFWSQLLASGEATPVTMRAFVPGVGWTTPVSPVPAGLYATSVAQHPDGRVAIFYRQGPANAPADIVLRRYLPAMGWRDPEIVDQGAVSGLCFAGDALVAAWQRSGGQGVVGVFP